MPKREKRTVIKISLNDAGVAALDLLRMHSFGVSVSELMNTMVCKQASRIDTAARARLEAIAARRDNETIRQLRKDNERLKKQLDTNNELVEHLLKEFGDMADIFRQVAGKESGGDDTAQ